MNIGIFGVGSFGEKHIKVIQDINQFNIIGFYDPDKKKSTEISNKYQLTSFESPIELINHCNAIDVVSNTSSHYKIIEKCIELNKNIFIEKPICSSQTELNNIINKTQNYQPIIQVGHIERYNPAIKDGFSHFNNIQSISSKRTGSLNKRNQNTSITLDLMIHDIDLVISNVKSKIININALGKNKINNLCNHVTCEIIFENGIVAKLTAVRDNNMENERKFTINLPEQKIEIDLLHKEKNHIYNDKIKTHIYKKNTNLLELEFLEFYNCIKNNKQPIVGPNEACAAVNIALEIDKLIN
ncbi:MAG: hypothetical protein CMP49_01855 [Flavobacteriales bacterium]|nr:hypothetical protein [Flavobacteriales bacterium]|tara:strand:+ start:631 stop:1527 length:897 start_codon:yes stop_codon:yes gene_type:complete